jgi:hypothetical protein
MAENAGNSISEVQILKCSLSSRPPLTENPGYVSDDIAI